MINEEISTTTEENCHSTTTKALKTNTNITTNTNTSVFKAHLSTINTLTTTTTTTERHSIQLKDSNFMPNSKQQQQHSNSSSRNTLENTYITIPVADTLLMLEPCSYQVAGHLFENGKAGSWIDRIGNFYKPLQSGQRGNRELAFYRKVFKESDDGSGGRPNADEDGHKWDLLLQLRSFVPRFYDVVKTDKMILLVLEDVVKDYSKPCVMDIKIGHRTWYLQADEKYIRRAKEKDASTTQASLGFKICGWQAYRARKEKPHRASKTKCKTLRENQVKDAFMAFADTQRNLGPAEVYAGCCGIIGKLKLLRSWFQSQTFFHFYSSSILLIYEGSATCEEEVNATVKLVDFAHTIPVENNKDVNFIQGLDSLICWLEDISNPDCYFTNEDRM